jgi:hypothetical protein
MNRGWWIWFPAESLHGVGPPATVRGDPRVVPGPNGVEAVRFDGRSDALVLPRHPLSGATDFSLEAVIRPALEGAAEERVVHLDVNGSSDRVLLETRRMCPGAPEWYADTIVSRDGRSCILNTPERRHPVGEWRALAVVCRAGRMSQYVDGVEEAAIPCPTRVLGEGSLCVGMRLNHVTPFCGEVLAVRCVAAALDPESLWSSERGWTLEAGRSSLVKGDA